jgi:transposase
MHYETSCADRIKLIFWDGTGVCLYAKRLEDGRFQWPGVGDAVMRLTAAQLSALLEGIDWRRVHAVRDGQVRGRRADAGSLNLSQSTDESD